MVTLEELQRPIAQVLHNTKLTANYSELVSIANHGGGHIMLCGMLFFRNKSSNAMMDLT